jgi:large subunit ribosomal protein L23
MNAARKTAEKPAEKTAKPAKTRAAAKPVSAPGVNEGRLMTVLLAPVISEKATFIADKHNQVIFRVRQDATKKDVKAAVELLWKDKKVEVAGVQMVNVRGKSKRFGAYAGRRRNWKKAYVSLKPGTEINFAQEA